MVEYEDGEYVRTEDALDLQRQLDEANARLDWIEQQSHCFARTRVIDIELDATLPIREAIDLERAP